MFAVCVLTRSVENLTFWRASSAHYLLSETPRRTPSLFSAKSQARRFGVSLASPHSKGFGESVEAIT